MSEMRIGIRDLKARLSDYLRQVRQGQVIVITDHGQAVGRILPAESSLYEIAKNLQSAGLADWNGKKLKEIQPEVVNSSQKTIADLLVDMRE
jgi:prevent-host-death family protein